MPETYATAAEVLAAWPGLAAIDEAEQAELIAVANAAVNDALRRDVLLAERTERHSGRNRSRIWLKVRPVVAVASVAIDGIGAVDEYRLDPETGELVRGPNRGDPRFGPWFPRGVRNVEVVYTGGYDPVPPPIKRAVILTARRIHDAGGVSGVYASESIGDYSYTLGDGSSAVPDAALRLLRPYRDPGA